MLVQHEGLCAKGEKTGQIEAVHHLLPLVMQLAIKSQVSANSVQNTHSMPQYVGSV